MKKRLPFKLSPRAQRWDQVLGPREAEVMEWLWLRSPASVAEVHRDLGQRHKLAYTTIMTIMSRLVQKGLLTRSRSGNAYLYTPTVTQEELGRQVAQGMVNGLLDGLTRPALAYFVDRLAQEDEAALDELERLIRERRSPEGGP